LKCWKAYFFQPAGGKVEIPIIGLKVTFFHRLEPPQVISLNILC